MKLLIAAKGDVNAKANDGMTAMMLASRKDHAEVVKLLEAAGAKE